MNNLNFLLGTEYNVNMSHLQLLKSNQHQPVSIVNRKQQEMNRCAITARLPEVNNRYFSM